MMPTQTFFSTHAARRLVAAVHADDAVAGFSMPGVRRYQAPQGQLETAIAAIWQDLLGQTCIGRHADFFELGGHSALAVQLVHRVRHALGADIGLRALCSEPVLHRFAQLVAASTGRARAALSGPSG